MVRDVLLGKEQIESRLEYKYALLRAQLGILLGAICFIYIFIDTLNGVPVYLPWYVGGIVASCLVIYLNRKRRYLVSSIVLLVTANILVFLIASLENTQGGAFFYFMATSAIGLVVLNPIHKRLGMIFVGLSLSLAALAFFGERVPMEAPKINEDYEAISFTVNFILGLLSCILVLIFVMNRNKESESILEGKQEELRALAKELEKSKNRYAMALEGTEAGIYEWDIPSNKVFVSSRYKSILGYDPDEELDIDLKKLLSMIHPEDAARSAATIDSAVMKGTRYQNELRMQLKNGRYRWFLDSGVVSMKDGTATQAVGSIIDIHDRKIAEQLLRDKNSELEKTNEELDRFVYSASHDMRAPLSTLLGLLNLAKLTKTEKELDEYHDLMANRINTMEGFIREVTDYSRNTRLEVAADTVNVLQLVEEVRDSFEFLAQESQVEFNIEIDPDIVIQVDKARLMVVVNNLVFNAIKYHDTSKSRRIVKIQASADKSSMLLRIIDNGIGIHQEYQDRIFDMFFRASEVSIGSGLGLYIARETLIRLKGSITCQSEIQKGSTFEIRIPVDIASAYETME